MGRGGVSGVSQSVLGFMNMQIRDGAGRGRRRHSVRHRDIWPGVAAWNRFAWVVNKFIAYADLLYAVLECLFNTPQLTGREVLSIL